MVSCYYSEHQIVYLACQEAQGLWGFSGATGGRPPCFLRVISGGNRSPELVEGNAESRPRAGHGYVTEKTRPGASERKKSPMTLRNVDNILLSLVKRQNGKRLMKRGNIS
jgi:hypothetical protein